MTSRDAMTSLLHVTLLLMLMLMLFTTAVDCVIDDDSERRLASFPALNGQPDTRHFNHIVGCVFLF